MKDPVVRYLERSAIFDKWPLQCADFAGVEQVVVIPALAEHPRLFDTLDDLAANPEQLLPRTLVVCVVNNRAAPRRTPEERDNNQDTLAALSERMLSGPLRLACIDASSPGCELPAKDGVGLARKLGLDWGLRVLHQNGCLGNALICLDADTRVDPNYLEAIRTFYAETGRWAAIIDFAHPLDGPEDEAAAIACYECFLRYHELGLALAESPYAFPSIGSTITCTGAAYAAVSGMRRSRAGEDFYFLQQLAKTGRVERITAAAVRPSSRPSHRTPFGTGRSVQRFLEGADNPYIVYHPACYRILKAWLAAVRTMPNANAEALLATAREIDSELAGFLESRRFPGAWERLRANAAGPAQLLAQFHRWFDGFQTLKLIHHLRDHGYPCQELSAAVKDLSRGLQACAPHAQDPNLSTPAHTLRFLRQLCSLVNERCGARGLAQKTA